MQPPPFRLARATPGAVPMERPLQTVLGGVCCAPAPPAVPPPARRSRLAELDAQFHCSVIGTCLSTQELRRLVPRHVPGLDRQRASDLDIHHEAVRLAHAGGEGAKALHKALEQCHQAAVKRLAGLKDAAQLSAAWTQALASGDIPGPYWALMTHAHATPAMRAQAFGDVHMLSHLVGAANRADIRRLQALEQAHADLKDTGERQQARIQQLTLERTALTNALHDLRTAAPRAPAAAGPDDALARAQARLAEREQALAHHTRRRAAAETQTQAEREARDTLQRRLDKALELVDALQAEVRSAEDAWTRHLQAEGAAPPDRLRGRRVVYVGGRPTSNRSIRAMVQAEGGELLLHDGGIEDRKGLLAAALPGADMAVFPVDCIDHDAMATVKRICGRHGVPFHPVRSASAASFAALLDRLAVPPAAPPSRFCLRHG